ncbi:hypothetical protein IW261DRAFT_1683254 [Armillaria novae-zelandiae]|uniref:Uncharacterized protein n=1 Tax=Armillaria novae-zelandiae TaxID=153914 RepID=A0AA39PDS7_9AGAR|nr:hypothetical protein IW261DRAFT_1683254 [Armillaria novae-zelandiae]
MLRSMYCSRPRKSCGIREYFVVDSNIFHLNVTYYTPPGMRRWLCSVLPQSFTEALTERYGPAIPIFIESDSSIFSEVSAAEAADFCPKTTYRHPASWTLHQDHLKSDFQSLGLHRWETLCPNDVSSSDFCPEATYRLPASWAMHHQYLRFLSRDAVSTSGELNCDSSLTPKFQTFLPYRAGIKIRQCMDFVLTIMPVGVQESNVIRVSLTVFKLGSSNLFLAYFGPRRGIHPMSENQWGAISFK